MNILFTCAGRRTYLLKYFKEQLNGHGSIFGADMQLSAPALSAADVKLKVPSVYSLEYIDVIVDICKKNKIDLLISLNDLELPVLAKNQGRFEEVGTTVLVSSINVIDICFDKYKTAEFVKEIGLETPKTFLSLDRVKSEIEKGLLGFPLILKPRWGSGSIGIEIVHDEKELEHVYFLLKNKIRRSILSVASVGDEFILVQEMIEGEEYGLDVMNDYDGVNHGVSVKKKLSMRAGETDKAVTVSSDILTDIGKKLSEKLRHIGNLDVDVLERDGRFYVLELNPRFGGGFPFSYEAGVNYPLALIEWLRKKPVDDSILVADVGRTFAKCDYLVNID